LSVTRAIVDVVVEFLTLVRSKKVAIMWCYRVPIIYAYISKSLLQCFFTVLANICENPKP